LAEGSKGRGLSTIPERDINQNQCSTRSSKVCF
jgi:hypothetical protein